MHFSQASEARGSPEDPAAGGHVRVREHVSAGAGVDMCMQVHVGACEGGGAGECEATADRWLDGRESFASSFYIFYTISFWWDATRGKTRKESGPLSAGEAWIHWLRRMKEIEVCSS